MVPFMKTSTGTGLRPASLLPGPPQRQRHAIGMVNAFGIARDLGADHASRVGVVRRAAHAADGAVVENFHVERAGRWAIVRTGRMTDPDGLQRRADGLIHD